jgi:hypothetical protein
MYEESLFESCILDELVAESDALTTANLEVGLKFDI